MRDVYHREIERCARMSAYELDVAWTLSAWHSPLFDICDAERTREGRCGCLTQVREGSPAQTPKLTTAIRRDLSIPSSIVALHRGWDDLSIDERRARLEPFARWQRRLDAEIPRREPPQEPA